MEQDDVVHGGPALDRQARPERLDVSGRPLVPGRVPETRPTPLRDAFIYLSIVVLVCGVVAIMALELGTPVSSLVVKIPLAIGGVTLLAVSADAAMRVWRSALAWLPVDRGRGLFRLVWCAVLVGSIVVVVVLMWLILSA